MPSRADALRFATDQQTSADQLRQACDLLGLPVDGSPDLIRTRVVGHLETLDAHEPVVCLNPGPPRAESAGLDPLGVVRRFNDACNRHDVDAVMALMTEDCVFENTRPAPDGTRFEGSAAVRAFWVEFFARSPEARFEFTDLFAAGDRCVARWTYHWVRPTGSGHVRGVDVFRVRDGKVAEKLSYVKG